MADEKGKKPYPNQPDMDSQAEEEEDLGYIELADDVIAIVARVWLKGFVSKLPGVAAGLQSM